MSILGIDTKNQNWKLRKTILVYMILSLTAIAVDNIYALFGHGVRSAFMTWMFLYPLIGGTLLFLMMELLIPEISKAKGYRLFRNTYNSGIATLTVGSFLQGVFEIAGTNSTYTILFYVIGGGFIAAGLILFLVKPLRNVRKERNITT